MMSFERKLQEKFDEILEAEEEEARLLEEGNANKEKVTEDTGFKGSTAATFK
jgi:hypothetical protein